MTVEETQAMRILALENQIEKLKIEKPNADQIRLDWMHENASARIWLFWAKGCKTGQTIREAIDAAMQHDQHSEEPPTP